MNKIDSIINKLDNYNIVDIFNDVSRELRVDFIDDNTNEQLFEQGIDADGNKLPLPYAPFTIEYKEAVGQPTDRITLRDTGEFYESVDVKYKKREFEIISKDEKYPELQKQWGNILGLTDKNLQNYIDFYYKEAAINKLREVFNG